MKAVRLRALISSFARACFPPKAITDRVVPWIQVVVTIAGGAWALLQYSTSIGDKRADETMKLLAVYWTEQGTAPSLRMRFDRLLEDEREFLASDTRIAELRKKGRANRTEAETQSYMNLLDEKTREFAAKPAAYGEYSRVYYYLNTLVVCAAEKRCDRTIVNSTLGLDLLYFLNGTCGFINLDDEHWNTRRTGQNIYDYVVSQQLEALSETKGGGRFLCPKFSEQYRARGWLDRTMTALGL